MMTRLKVDRWSVLAAVMVVVALGGAAQLGLVSQTFGDEAAKKPTVLPAMPAQKAAPAPVISPSFTSSTPDPAIIWTEVEPHSSSYGSIFARASDTDIWRRLYKNAAWTAWEHIPYSFSSSPAAASGGSSGDYLFARGNNNALYYRKWYLHYHDGVADWAWTDWQGLGGVKTSGPAAVYSGGGVYAFARGTDNQFYYRFLSNPSGSTPSWTSWQAIGGAWNSGPAVTVGNGGFGPTGVYVFGRGMDNALYYRWGGHSDGWLSDWKFLGGAITSTPAVVQDRIQGRPATLVDSGSFYAFAKGTDNTLWYRTCTSACWQPGNWDVWRRNGFVMTSAPAASIWGNDASPSSARGIMVVARGTDNALWSNLLRSQESATAWRGWERIP